MYFMYVTGKCPIESRYSPLLLCLITSSVDSAVQAVTATLGLLTTVDVLTP